jgi:very-short-patch-repair endonuclease
MPNKIPKALSEGEECFDLHCRAKMLNPVREYKFCDRGWRFDFAFPGIALAIEIEGGTWSGGRHSRGSGFEADCAKYNRAAMLGWKVLRYSTEMVQNGTAIHQVVEYIENV